MAGLTKEQAEELLELWVKAEKAVATGQSYSIGGRSLTRADAKDITDKIKFYSKLCNQLERGGKRVQRVFPNDD